MKSQCNLAVCLCQSKAHILSVYPICLSFKFARLWADWLAVRPIPMLRSKSSFYDATSQKQIGRTLRLRYHLFCVDTHLSVCRFPRRMHTFAHILVSRAVHVTLTVGEHESFWNLRIATSPLGLHQGFFFVLFLGFMSICMLPAPTHTERMSIGCLFVLSKFQVDKDHHVVC
jgi:hypothetical protein